MKLHFFLLAFLGLLLSRVALCQPPQPNASYKFVQDWKTFLGPRDATTSYVFRAAVCPDGSAYLSDGNGRLIRVNSQGQKVQDVSDLNAVRTTVALACNANGQVIAGTTAYSFMTTLEPDGAGFKTVSSLKPVPAVLPFDILPIPGANLVAVLGRANGDRHPMHTVLPGGTILSNFGGLPPQLSDELSLRAGMNGTLLWDAGRRSILYVPENPYTLTEFTPAGQMLKHYDRGDADFHPIFQDVGTGVALPNDRILRAAFIGNDKLFVQIVKHKAIGSMVVNSADYSEIVDTHLRPLSDPLDSLEYGHLWGSDRNGNIYSTIISPTEGISLLKGHLVEK